MRKFTKNIGIVGITTILASLQRVLLIPILSKFLGPEYYGVWSQIMVTVALLAPLATLGFTDAVIRFLSGKEKVSNDYYGMVSITSLTGIIISLFMFLFSNQLSNLTLGGAEYSSFFKVSSALVFFSCFNLMTLQLYRSKHKLGVYSLVSLLDSALEFIVISTLVYLEKSLYEILMGVVIAKLIVFLVNTLITIMFCGLKFPNLNLKKYLKFSFPLIFIPIFTWVVQISDQYVVGFYLGAASVGIYSLIYSLGFFIKLIYSPILIVLQPTISSFWNNKEFVKVDKYLYYGYKVMMILGIGVAFGLISLSDSIIELISTSDFLIGKSFLPLISLAFLFQIASSTMSQILTLQKRTKVLFYTFLIASMLNIILNLFLVPYLGLIGAVISTNLTFIFLLATESTIALKNFNFSFQVKNLIKFSISGCLMAILISFLKTPSLLYLIFHTFLGGFLYFSFLYFFKGISKRELELVISIFKKNSNQ